MVRIRKTVEFRKRYFQCCCCRCGYLNFGHQCVSVCLLLLLFQFLLILFGDLYNMHTVCVRWLSFNSQLVRAIFSIHFSCNFCVCSVLLGCFSSSIFARAWMFGQRLLRCVSSVVHKIAKAQCVHMYRWRIAHVWLREKYFFYGLTYRTGCVYFI